MQEKKQEKGQQGAQQQKGATSTTPRRGPGSKEVIPLAWKLVGISDGMPVTLLKCVERIEAEAQLERLQGERYYKNLGIYAIDDRVPVPAAAAKARQKTIAEAISRIVARSERAKANRGKARASQPGAGGTGTGVRASTASRKKPAGDATAKKKTVKLAKAAAKSKPKSKGGTKPVAKAKRPPKAKAKAVKKTVKKAAKKAAKRSRVRSSKKTTRKSTTTKSARSASKPKSAKAKKSSRRRK